MRHRSRLRRYGFARDESERSKGVREVREMREDAWSWEKHDEMSDWDAFRSRR